MNERRSSSASSKRKGVVHIRSTGGRIQLHQAEHSPHNALSKGKDQGYSAVPSHPPRFRSRSFGSSTGIRAATFKSHVSRYTSQLEREVLVSNSPPKHIIAKRVLDSNSLARCKNGSSGNDKPATFVCEGIEVKESSDSEDEVHPWRVVKVLKKDNVKSCVPIPGLLDSVSSTEESGRRRDIIQRVKGKVLHKNELSNREQNCSDMQASVPPSKHVVLPQSSSRPSYVVLSGIRKRSISDPPGSVSNCAVIKRPRFLFSQHIRTPLRQSQGLPRVLFPRFQDPTSSSADLTLQELRIIEDVLDMMEEVERRAQCSNSFQSL